MKLISACLLGVKCRYDGKDKADKRLVNLSKKEIFIPVCPEQLGGLTTPRDRAVIIGKDGSDVFLKKANVNTFKGKNVTKQYIKGAKETLKIAKLYGIKEAILKAYSPSCGCGQIYSKDFLNKKKGDGVTAALLKKNGIKIKTELDYK